GKDAYNLYVDKYWPNRQPYSNIKNTLRYFNSWLGIRAVLWAHGENDAQLGFTENVYFDNIRTLVETSRKDAGFSAPWIMARSSAGATIMQPYQPIINAQNRFFNDKSWHIYPGPDLDLVQIPRPGHGHFENVPGGVQGLSDAAKAWNAVLTDSFLDEIKPLQPAFSIHTGVTPLEVKPGDPFLLPYRVTGGAATNLAVHAELLNDQNEYVTTLATRNQSPLTVTMPQTLPNGTYKIRVTGSSPTMPGSISDRFYVHTNLPGNQYVNHIFSRREGNNIHVSWLVSANSVINRITLQKTTNGLSYTDIANLQITDNRNTSHLYAYTDQETSTGSVFYRVTLDLADGTTTTSSISTVFNDESTPYLLVFPNPVVDQTFRFRIDPRQEILECKLYDVKGREFGLNTNEREMSGSVTARPVIHIPPGNYILQVITNGGSIAQSILVL
ncbi:MAG TPA: T9SS type A sorting domain-containing protein, partial [Dyadobacter sp.]|nr:T9SS type A sorting domain-containing protein [Dyadobacter sp.]